MLSDGIAFVDGVGAGAGRNVEESVRRLDEVEGCREDRTRLCEWPIDDSKVIEYGCTKLLAVVGRAFAAGEDECAPSAKEVPRAD